MPKVTKEDNNRIARRGEEEGSILDRIEDININPEDGLKVVLYGRSGTGKTTCWATFPKPILALICSGTKKPDELRSINLPQHKGLIKTARVEHSMEIVEVARAIEDGGILCKTLVIDHVTALQTLILKQVLKVDKLPSRMEYYFGAVRKADWGEVGVIFQDAIQEVLNLDCNVVLVAQERSTEPEEGSQVIAPTVGAGLTPGNAGFLNSTVSFIFQTFWREKEVIKEKVGLKGQIKRVKRVVPNAVDYCLRVRSHTVFHAKFRLPVMYNGVPLVQEGLLPEYIVDPSYEKIIGLIRMMEDHAKQALSQQKGK